MKDKTDHVRILVAVGDITSFGSWFAKITDINTELKPFFIQFDRLIDKLSLRDSLFFKDVGDGFMVIEELNEEHACKKTISLLRKMAQFKKEVNRLIELTPYPRPEGFRIRLACGHAWKRQIGQRVDYLGRHVNLAFKLLRVHRDKPIVIHESVYALMSPKQKTDNGFNFLKLPLPLEAFEDIYREDVKNLWSFNLNGYKRLGGKAVTKT